MPLKTCGYLPVAQLHKNVMYIEKLPNIKSNENIGDTK
jgi:hypothetical protein